MSTEKTKVILYGCYGRMGTAVSNLIAAASDIEIVTGIDMIASKEIRPYPVDNSICNCKISADVVINFAPPTASDDILELLNYCVSKQVSMVIGTTSLPHKVEAGIAEASKKVAIFQASNLSLGLNLFANIMSSAANLLYNSQFDIEIIEKHHNKKLDAPSGTALTLAQIINESVDNSLRIVTDRSQQHEERSRNEIGVHAIRGGSITGEHSIIFAGTGETIEFTHKAESRDVFAHGAIKAAQFICGKPAGMYGMKDLLRV